MAFSLASSIPGITVSPESGITPAVVHITVDPSVFVNAKGTSVGYLDITAPGAVNIPDRVRVLVNSRDPDQRGLVQNIPGKLVDVLSDSLRNQFMVIRQDTNEILVFDRNLKQIGTL